MLFNGTIMTVSESGKLYPASLSRSWIEEQSSIPLFPEPAGIVPDSALKFFNRAVSIVVVTLAVLTGCTSIPVEERESRRAEIDRAAEETIATLSEKDEGFSAALENAAVGKSASQGAVRQGGQKAYIISDSGAALTATARIAKLSVNEILTDTGLSEISIPNIGMGIEDGRAPTEHRTWDHKLPFMAQKVIDMGYDLPLPFGVTVLYTDIEQGQVLENLEVGFSGGAKEPFEWVEFQNAVSFTDTWQVVGDMWVLPFLNVFGFIGDLTGDIALDVLLDGNGMLDQLDIDCGRPGNLVLCNLLEDRLFELPIRSKFSGNNYGVGFNLAGGWKGFFFTVPVLTIVTETSLPEAQA